MKNDTIGLLRDFSAISPPSVDEIRNFRGTSARSLTAPPLETSVVASIENRIENKYFPKYRIEV